MNEALVQSQEGFSTRCQKVLQVARELFQSKPDWVTFFRETLGVSGAARNVFPRQQDYVAFEKSREYAEIQGMVLALRNRKIPGSSGNEPTRVITVRLPESLHEALKAEAADHNTSMNKLCISKLLQVLIDSNSSNKSAPQQRAPQPPMRTQQPQPQTGQMGQPVGRPAQPVQQPAVSTPPSFRSTYNQASSPQPSTPQPGQQQPGMPPRNHGQ